MSSQPHPKSLDHQRLTISTVGGDSGAWIVDNATGAVCGHVTAWNERGSYGILAPMEVMLHDMEQTLKQPVALPTTGMVGQCSYHEQIVAHRPRASAYARDEAVDMTCASHPGSLNCDCENLAEDHAIGQHFLEQSVDESTQPSTIDTSEFSQLEQSSRATSPAVATSPPPPTRSLGDMKLDDVADRWTKAQMHQRGAAIGTSKNLREVRESSVQPGLKAQC